MAPESILEGILPDFPFHEIALLYIKPTSSICLAYTVVSCLYTFFSHHIAFFFPILPHPPSLSSPSAVDPPRIIEHPRDMLNVTPGTNATFTVVASGLRLTYTWVEGDGEAISSNRGYVMVDGTLTIPIVSRSDTGSFHCLVSNAAGNVTSQSVNLTLSKLCTY